MSDRPAPPATPARGTAKGTGSPSRPTGPPPSTRPPTAAGSSGPDLGKRPTAPPSADAGDTAVRPGLAERIQAKLAQATSAATDSRRGGAAATSTSTPPAPQGKARPRGPRRARLRLTRIDPWSVMKTAFLLSIAFGVVTVVAVAMIWQVIGAAGVWESINSSINEVVTEPGSAPFDIRDYVGTDRVLGFTMLVAAVDVVLITAIATLGAFLYNMSAALLGGIEVTLAEDNA
ncbi:DUF3566 domain-containing protein [Nocardioides litoris]|uniref:DUF3566 domain-containing protein n=1 Tax=Nocardioides litoris TaxID=1926648 RepID=UPI00111F7223|nr:DUF3566 domain-containing protein [Nocardioides litoris]